MLFLAEKEQYVKRSVRSVCALTAYLEFGDASSLGLGSTVKQPDRVHNHFGLWARDEEGESSNYRELQNLVETVKEKAGAGYLTHGKLWIFTDKLMAESCFFWSGLSSKLLHKLVLQLRKAEMTHKFVLHMVHVAGTRMIEQGMDRLS